MEDTSCSVEIALAWAVAARNSLQNCHGFSPNQLVFGRNPAIPSVFDSSPAQLESLCASQLVADNINAMHAARRDFVCNESNERIRRALLHQIRHDDEEIFQNGENVYYKRNDDNRWRGPGVVIGRDGKQILVRHGGVYVRVHICRLQRAPTKSRHEECSDNSPGTLHKEAECSRTQSSSSNGMCPEDIVTVPVEDDDSEEIVQERTEDAPRSPLRTPESSNSAVEFVRPSPTMIAAKSGQRIEYYDIDGERNTCTVLNRAGKVGGIHGHSYNIKTNSGNIEWIDLARNVQKWRPIPDDEEVLVNSSSSDVFRAKCSEIDNWKSNSVFEEVPDAGQRAISLRWVITEKIIEDRHVTKARLVARGFEESLLEKRTDSPTCSKDALRVALVLISAFHWKCSTFDVKSAFLQGNEIDRDVFVKPPKEFGDGQLWHLKKNIYGLNDAARAWYYKLKEELLNLQMSVCTLDPALFFWIDGGVISGIMCVHVDDILWGGTPDFEAAVIIPLCRRIVIGSTNTATFRYIGVHLSQEKDFSVTVNQVDYAESLEEVKLSRQRSAQRSSHLEKGESDEFRSLLGQLNWLATQTRPDIAFDVCELSTSLSRATVEEVLRANKVLKRIQQRPVMLKFCELEEPEQLNIECYSDASFGNLQGGGSQGGYIVFLADNRGCKCLVSWQSRKVRRVVKSTLAAETLALLDAAESGIFVASMIGELLNIGSYRPTVKCFVDNKSLVETLHSTRNVDDKHLRINIAVLREMIEKRDITVSWVQSAKQLANALTKRGADASLLLSVIRENRAI